MALQIHTTTAFAFGSAVVGGTAFAASEFLAAGTVTIGAGSVQSTARMWFTTEGTVRFRYDGGTPTAAAGHAWYSTSGRLEILGNNNIQRFRVIAASGTPVCFVTLEG